MTAAASSHSTEISIMNAFRFVCAAALSLALVAPAFAKSASRMRLLASPDPAKIGRTVRLQAEVDGRGLGPTGKVTFSDGAVVIGAALLSRIGAGQATLTGGATHACAVSAAGGARCWGGNDRGALGDGSTKQRDAPVDVQGLSHDIVAVTGGILHSCALTSAGAVKCWGFNNSGILGDGTSNDRLRPVGVSGLSSGVVAVAAGAVHTCALTSAGAAKCWGYNSEGQLGDGTTSSRRTPVDVAGLSSGVVAITGGREHTCAATSAGAVKCWGYNDRGQIGDGTTSDHSAPVAVSGLSSGVVGISAGGAHSCALTSAGAVLCWGANFDGQLGDGTYENRSTPVAVSGLSSGVVAISAGEYHTCALTGAGAVLCWGSNSFGALGDASTPGSRPIPGPVTGLSSGVRVVAAGGSHTCALTSAGAVQCWGQNFFGQIGDGTNTHRSTPTPVLRLTPAVRGRALLSTRSLGVGAHTLQASFPGDAAHDPSSAAQSQTIVP
ncbi:hypothetical protein A8B73_14895 [Methylosinus sp. 3S-1]|nr:hypothetical protein A8B73_14895 [Methylosinus sp. 3S-1]